MKKIKSILMTIAIMLIFNANCFAAMNIADARALGDDAGVEVGPIYISTTNDLGNSWYYIFAQDESGGVQIAGPGTTIPDLISANNLVPGSCVTLVGTNSSYGNAYQITWASISQNHGVSNLPPAILIDTDTLAIPAPDSSLESLEGKLVAITGVDFFDSGTFAGVTSYTISKNGTNGIVRIQDEHDPLVGSAIPLGSDITITGIFGIFFSNYQIFPLDVIGPTREPYLWREPYPDLNFGIVYPNYDRTLQITIKNGGETANLDISAFSATSGDTANFSPSSIPNFTLPPSGKTNLNFVYTPGSSASASHTAIYEFQSNDVSNQNNSFSIIGASSATPPPTPAVWINEVAVNDPGTDAEEFIELCGVAGTDISGWKLVLYNGYDGSNYAEHVIGSTLPGSSFTFVLPDDQDGFGFYVLQPSDSSVPNADETAIFDSIQHSTDDAIRLSAGSTQIHFFAYESQTARTYEDLGLPNDLTPLADSSADATSLSLVGVGTDQPEFIWNVVTHTSGALNTDQVLPEPGLLIAGIALILLSFRRK